MRQILLTAVLAIAFAFCREVTQAQESACTTPASDQWSSFAHDGPQTSASSIDVGDPDGVTVAWRRNLPRLSSFTSPTVHGDRVYVSTDSELNAYDLATGALIGVLSGPPEMGSSNRGNTTVAYITALARDVVFASGGNFNAITALEVNLESAPLIWSNNVVTFNSASGLGLGQMNRFNTSKVVDVAGTQVLFICTEPAAGTGLLYAFVAATGALYPGWAINPVILDAAAKHGPAVNGGKLYVGTAIGGTNTDGALYQIDAATGAIDWTFTGTNSAMEGWPAGVSAEGDFVYGATADTGNIGVRYKIDVSGALPSVVWSATQGRGLYGTPTIGRDAVYFPLDVPSAGILQVDKASGLVTHNFAASDFCGVSVSAVPLIATLSCDAYLFAGDRDGRWWLFDAATGDAQWYRQWPIFNGGEIVSGTALASHSGGTDYAVVAVRQLGGTVGRLTAFALNQGARPRLIQCKNLDTILVPLGAGPGNPHHVDDVFINVGNAPLNISALSITDPPPDGMSSAALAAPLSGRATARAQAAAASTLRTSAVLVGGAAVPTTIAPGATAGLDWVYDGAGLGRGQDANVLAFTMDDPDFNYDGSPVATFHILYQGPCACDCHTDPACDGIINDVQDVVKTIDVAFRGAAAIPDPNGDCPYESTDMDCSGLTDVVDIVKVVGVSFRGADPATEYCVACP